MAGLDVSRVADGRSGEWLDREVDPRLLYKQKTIDLLSDYVAQNHATMPPRRRSELRDPEPTRGAARRAALPARRSFPERCRTVLEVLAYRAEAHGRGRPSSG